MKLAGFSSDFPFIDVRRALPAVGFALLSGLAYADNSASSASPAASPPPLGQNSVTLAEGSASSDPSQRSLLHSIGLLEEAAGTFEPPKMPAAPPPAGLFGVYMVPKGKFVVNYMPIWWHFQGLQSGTGSINPAQAATTVPAYNIGGNVKERILPTQAESNAQLLAGMYGITNYLNVILMPSYVSKNSSYVTYAGASGATALGAGSVTASGAGDTYASLQLKLYEGYNQELIVSWGMSFPSGSITRNADSLAPNGKIVNARLPYGMQLGDGTYDATPMIAYTGNYEHLAWGFMTRARLPMQSYNSQGWRMGNLYESTGWLGYEFVPSLISTTIRFTGSTQDSIHGMDPQIAGLSSGGNPNFYGGQVVKGLIGLNVRQSIPQINGGGRIALEAGMPLYRNLNGVQVPEQWSLQLSAALLF